MLNQNRHVKKLKSKLVDIKYSTNPSKNKLGMSLSELTKRAREVRDTFKDEDFARYKFAQ